MQKVWILLYLCTVVVAASENDIDTIQFSTDTETVTIEEGEDAILPCSVHSIMNYTITWESGKSGVLMTGDTRVTSDSRFFLRQEGTGDWSLNIREVGQEDEGVYNCVINTDPPLTKDITLTVGYAADVRASRSRVIKQKGKRAKLECMVSGKPSPGTMWMKGDTEVKADNRHVIDIIDKGEYNTIMRLKIKRLKVKDFGEYTCKAYNAFGPNSATINLIEPHRMMPTFDVKSENISAKPGSTVALPCRVDSLGSHKISWVSENLILLTMGDQRIIIDDRLHVERSMTNIWDLVISDVTASDAGVYTCQIDTHPPSIKTVTLRIGNPPVAETSERSLTKSVGDDIMLACTIRGYPQDFVTWTLNSSDIPIGDKYDIRIEDVDNMTSILTLSVRAILKQDFGLYMCIASNQFGSTESTINVLELELNDEPRFEDTPHNITVKEGMTATLPCSVVNLGEHKVMWVYGKLYLTVARKVVIRDNRFSIQKKGERQSWNLQIQNVKYRDAGFYRCRLDTDSPKVRTVFLNVDADSDSSGPMFESTTENVTAIAGSTAVLPCGVKELARYQVVWSGPGGTLLTFRSRRIKEDPRLKIDRPYHKDWNLHISQVNNDDEGRYLCQINTSPTKQRAVFLTVQVPAQLEEEWSSKDTLALAGKEAELVCNITGDPSPKVSWRRGESAKFCNGTQFLGELGEILHIPDVNRECDGAYECIAYNGIPPAVRYTIQLTVGVEPKVLLPYESIIQKISSDTVLECITTMNPPDEFYWYKGGIRLEEGTKYHKELYEEEDGQLTLSITITGLEEEDFGVYTCIASNFFGQDEKTLTLREFVEPPAPLPVINETLPGEVAAVAGETVVLGCTIHNVGNNSVTWWNNASEILTEGDRVLSPDTRMRVELSGGESWDLMLTDVRSSDAGVYTCLTEVDPDVISREVTLTVAVPSYFPSSSADEVVVSEGDNVTMECHASGDPTPAVTWSRGDTNNCLPMGAPHTGRFLEIREISRECSGEYMCTASNGYGEPAMKKINLIVQYPPMVSVQGEMVTQELGLDTRLECRVVTLPLGTVTWYKGTREKTRIDHDAKFKIEMRNEEGLFTLTLDIRGLQLEDFGEYSCRADNILGMDESSITLNSPAVVRSGLSSEDTLVKQGDSMALMCDAVGVPPPNVTWYKLTTAGVGQAQETPEEVVVSEGPELVFNTVQKVDQGIYKCVASNGYQSAVNSNYHLISVSVEYPPMIALLPTEDDDGDEDTTLLRCRITAFPQGIAMWKENGVEVINSDKHQIDINYIGNSTLELLLHIKYMGSKAYYYYTCVASNHLGEAREEVILEGDEDDTDDFDMVTEYDMIVDETTVETVTIGGGGRRRKPKKDRGDHSHSVSKDGKRKKHKKGKKHHRKEKTRKDDDDDDATIHRTDNEIDEDNMDDINDIDTDDNRVEIPYKTSNTDDRRSGQSKGDDRGGNSTILPSVSLILLLLTLGWTR